ncbi:cupin domain-containing protein [Devosia sp. PTR5]|uniref:Cupin domain-containing protein n=1 Tax=Devosia oryzisoli TaxID=2774138 RepID=A0A927ISP7_9HYPH|nr:ChrR family anti-sigma-E factor [Devosia oryzisoli]MBD8064921.1 cupin domain-containing protein [Devosia oryzisoli]
MTINHHPDISTLMAFTAGTLEEPFATVIATHLAMSEAGRITVRHMETIGGALLEDEPDAAMSAAATDRLLAALDGASEEPALPAMAENADIPTPLRPYLPQGLEGVKWKWNGPGVATADLARGRDGRSRLMLLRVAGGRRVPEHSHGGQELTLILQGAYRDRFGVFARGDIADHDEDVEHQPIAEPGPDCICLVAVDAKLSFRGRLMQALQPLFGI